MPDQDAVESKSFLTVKQIGVMAGELWQQAHMDGIRNGLEIAAAYAGKAAADYPACVDLPAADVVRLLIEMRDQLRLYALQLPDPAPVTGD